MQATHVTVLLEESVDALLGAPVATEAPIFVDGTFGRGGHARALLARMPAKARLIAFDRDPQAIAAARDIDDGRFHIIHAPFSTLAHELAVRSVSHIDGALFDLGVSSPQLDDSERGFSFMRDGPLDMRMDTTRGETAADWLARVDINTLTEVIRDYGEERFARSVAKAIGAACRARPEGRLERTGELADIVAKAVRTRERGLHPATRTFQAIRIAVNRELDELDAVLAQVGGLMSPGARLAVISFHSLEDRIVKRFMNALARPESVMDPVLKRLPVPTAQLPQARFRLVGKSIVASDAQITANPRARSARLRVLEKLA
jgi:16S rRNA (cytosine1402-N4)-methyltransferase